MSWFNLLLDIVRTSAGHRDPSEPGSERQLLSVPAAWKTELVPWKRPTPPRPMLSLELYTLDDLVGASPDGAECYIGPDEVVIVHDEDWYEDTWRLALKLSTAFKDWRSAAKAWDQKALVLFLQRHAEHLADRTVLADLRTLQVQTKAGYACEIAGNGTTKNRSIIGGKEVISSVPERFDVQVRIWSGCPAMARLTYQVEVSDADGVVSLHLITDLEEVMLMGSSQLQDWLREKRPGPALLGTYKKLTFEG